MPAALTLDDALMPYAAFARQGGMALPELLAALARETEVVQTLRKLTGGGAAQRDTLAQSRAKLDDIGRKLQEQDAAFANGSGAQFGFLNGDGRAGFKAQEALRLLQEVGAQSVANGTSEMTLDEINSEIAAVRRELRGN
ncbi:MAG: hypothetical protein J6T92_02225 [Ottowia sp.]|nr:hypothetical protein [Ottowia sp.]